MNWDFWDKEDWCDNANRLFLETMRKILLLVFFAFSLCSKAQKVDVLHYDFLVHLNDQNDSIHGLASIVYVKKTANDFISLDLASLNTQGRGMQVTFASTGRDTGSKGGFHHKHNKVFVKSNSVSVNDTAVLILSYTGIPADGLIISKNKHGERTFFADNWPNRAHHWIPCNDHPDDKASFEFTVRAPSNYSVISNGIKTEERMRPGGFTRTVWRENIPSPTKVMVIGAARFATKTYANSPEGIPVSAWVYPQDSTKGFYDYALAPDILKFFSDYIAPYPYKKLANVQSKTIFGGMENASAIFYAENSVTGDRSSEDLLAHEIAHQWFGDMASEKSFAHLWLSEGFATYLTNYYFEKKYGKEAANKRWREQREEVIQFAKTSSSPVVDSTSNLMSLLNANSYQKGAWVLHMLRNEVGDSIFQKIIQTYYNQYKGGNAETRDFEAIAEKVSGKELTWFFDQWLYRPGIPKLEISTKVQNNEFTLNVMQQGKPYRFKLDIAIIDKDEKVVRKQLEISEKETIIKVPVEGSSATFSIDPETKFLYELKD